MQNPLRSHSPSSRVSFYILFVLISLIMWLIVSSLSLHNLQFLLCCILSILIWLVLIALFYFAIRRDSLPLLRFPFLGLCEFFSREISLVHWSDHRVVFLPIFVFCLFSLLLVLVLSVPEISLTTIFWYCLWVVVSMHQRYQFRWQDLILLFLTHTVCLRVFGMLGLMHRHEFSCSRFHSLKFFSGLLQELSRVS